MIHSNIEIPIFQDLGTGKWRYNFNHNSYERMYEDVLGIEYSADSVIIEGTPTIEKIQNALLEAGLTSNTLVEDYNNFFNI